MLSSHLVFGDINNHSDFPIEERVKILEKYWEICENHRPNLNAYSFYETDNDSFMAGFSSLEGFFSGYDVLNFITSLNHDFENNNINVSFGINLMACAHNIEWSTYSGFINDIKMIYMPDCLFDKIGKIQRSRLAGDALIITARLQTLAKELNILGCISLFNDGHVDYINNYKLSDGKIIKSHEVTKELKRLGQEQCEWLTERKIKVFSMEIL